MTGVSTRWTGDHTHTHTLRSSGSHPGLFGAALNQERGHQDGAEPQMADILEEGGSEPLRPEVPHWRRSRTTAVF